GHFVLGHVDDVGTVVDVRPEADFTWVSIRFPRSLAPYFIPKGSVAVDGVSLTIATLGEDQFEVQLIPHTLASTTLRHLRPGATVNLECDVIGKYVNRAVSLAMAPPVVSHS